jgi:uncharacterized membrane protein YjgN (DUF898 family)
MGEDGAQSPAQGETLTFGQTIEPKAFLGISLKNGLLNLVTLTLYRFWGKTEVRRRVWSHITLNGEAFEYTGRGKELFLGFLLALVTLGVPYLAVLLATQFVNPLFAVLLLPMYLAIFVLIGAAIFLTFRYMASRTTWRGIRFRMRGSPADFGWAYLGYSFLSGLTLGWFAPAMSLKIAERLWGGLTYGDQKLSWARSYDENLYGRFAIAWIVGIVGYIALIAAMVPQMAELSRTGQEMGPSFILRLYGLALIYAVILMLATAPYHAALLRTIAKSVRMSGASFKLDARTGPMLGLTITNMLILIFSLGFLQPVVMARTARFLVSRLSSTGEAPLSEAHQTSQGPKTGEGLADAFDVSPF